MLGLCDEPEPTGSFVECNNLHNRSKFVNNHSFDMVLVRALSSLRASVLSKISIPAQSSIAQQSVGGAFSLNIFRGFAEGTYLDKSQVTDRIISVTKNFGKADVSKVRA